MIHLKILKCHFGHLVRENTMGRHAGEERQLEFVLAKTKICYYNNSDEILMGAETGDSGREDEKLKL